MYRWSGSSYRYRSRWEISFTVSFISVPTWHTLHRASPWAHFSYGVLKVQKGTLPICKMRVRLLFPIFWRKIPSICELYGGRLSTECIDHIRAFHQPLKGRLCELDIFEMRFDLGIGGRDRAGMLHFWICVYRTQKIKSPANIWISYFFKVQWALLGPRDGEGGN